MITRSSLLLGAPVIALALSLTSACAPRGPEVRSFVLRLRPGQEVTAELARLATTEHLHAASVVSAVGSLTDVALRYANQEATTRLTGHFEVVALSGYLADGELHLHMAVSDGAGATVGGHVMEGNRVYTTLVLVVDEHLRYRYRRALDPTTGRNELVIEARPGAAARR